MLLCIGRNKDDHYTHKYKDFYNFDNFFHIKMKLICTNK